MNVSHPNAPVSKAPAHDEPFSRASHFGRILAPIAIGVAYALLRDNADSALIRIGVFGLLLFGLGTGVKLLAGISEIRDEERRH